MSGHSGFKAIGGGVPNMPPFHPPANYNPPVDGNINVGGNQPVEGVDAGGDVGANALEDMKQNLAPIPRKIVQAYLNQLIVESEGKIKSIKMNKPKNRS